MGDDDVLPRDWGPLNQRLYRMFHSTVLPTILRNFDRLSMAHGIEVRMPFMDWRLVTYVMALPDSSKSSDGYTKVIARRAMTDQMPESIRMGRRKVGFNSPMPEWLNGPLADWTVDLLDRQVPAFAELVDEPGLSKTVRRPDVQQDLGLGSDRTTLAVSEHEVDAGRVGVSMRLFQNSGLYPILFVTPESACRRSPGFRGAAPNFFG